MTEIPDWRGGEGPRQTPTINPKEPTVKKLTLIALLTTIALPVLADAPVFPGRDALPCDPDRFTPIYSADGETILYWNNPTCVYGGSDQPNPEAEDEEVVVEEPGDDTPGEDEPVEEEVAALD